MWQGRPTYVEIDLDAVAHNVRVLKRHIGSAALCAVVKANGYGHGAVPVAATALEHGASWLAIACVDEGIQLREAGLNCPILVLGYAAPWEADKIVANRLTATVNTQQLALALAGAARSRDVTIAVHLKVDTGLTRFGLAPEEIVDFARWLGQLPGVQLEGLYTHFATADEPDKTFLRQQLDIYDQTLRRFEEYGIPIALRHTANSAAALSVPETHLDMVRCGITIYGLYPSTSVSSDVALKPVMTFRSEVSRVAQVGVGASVGYGRTFVADKRTRLALVPAGYGDGVARALSNRGSALIHGHRFPMVGRVSMDQCVVAVDEASEVRVGDEVVLIGSQGPSQITADDLAELLGTINYEVTCNIKPRVPRVYLKGGIIVGADTLNEGHAQPTA